MREHDDLHLSGRNFFPEWESVAFLVVSDILCLGGGDVDDTHFGGR